MSTDTMKAVVFHGPGKVIVEDRPIPKIQDDGDVIVKVDKVHLLPCPIDTANIV
jgi:threonine dehydrogenase-like Zn-dependent dehydrogenase